MAIIELNGVNPDSKLWELKDMMEYELDALKHHEKLPEYRIQNAMHRLQDVIDTVRCIQGKIPHDTFEDDTMHHELNEVINKIIGSGIEVVDDKIFGISGLEPTHRFDIYGIESRVFTVRSGGTSARINVPLEWHGKRVVVIRLD